MIPFNQPCKTGHEEQHILKALQSEKLSGDGSYSKQCEHWFENHLQAPKTLLTPSCTAALEITALLTNIQDGDEVIMPSYTFVSTANAFVLRGAKIVFIDINPNTMNIDETQIESAITPKTKAIVLVHYAGISCDIDFVMNIAQKHNLLLIEDAAQAMNAFYKGKPLGTFGDLATFSFHETKNYTSGGEGGLLIINNKKLIKKAEIIREKGTNRSQFFRGEIDKYSWVDLGSSFLPSELQAAYLWGQIEAVETINNHRLQLWNHYYQCLKPLEEKSTIKLPQVPKYSTHNAHIFYIKLASLQIRSELMNYLKKQGIHAVFHYVPLHSSIAGKKYGYFHHNDKFTTKESECLLRLPMFYNLKMEEVEYIAQKITEFF